MTDSPKRSLFVKILIIILPIWLVASSGGALWYYFYAEKKEKLVERERFTREISAPMMADDLRKIVEVIGERNIATVATKANLLKTASFITGLLGPSNTGYTVSRIQGPAGLPLLKVTIVGRDANKPPLWVVTSYDSRRGSRGCNANATGLAATLASAQALANFTPLRSIHFLFLPHANDLSSPLIQTVEICKQVIEKTGAACAVLNIEAMGADESLWFSAHDDSVIPLDAIFELGSIHGCEVADMTSLLSKANLPAIRIATRAVLKADEKDEHLPLTSTVVAATGKLVEFIRRCAAK